MPEYLQFLTQYLSKFLAFFSIIIATTLLIRVIKRLFKRAIIEIENQKNTQKNSKSDFLNFNLPIDSTQLQLINKITIAITYFIGFCLAFIQIPELKHSAYSLLAGSGVIAVILTFALREALSNILAGIFIAIFEPFKIGNFIKIDSNQEGLVKDITLHHTILEKINKDLIIIPNNVISNKSIEKKDQKHENLYNYDLYISRFENINKIINTLQIILDSHELIFDKRKQAEKQANKPITKVNIENIRPNYIQVRSWFWTKDDSTAYKIKTDTNFKIKSYLDKQKNSEFVVVNNQDELADNI